MKTRLILWSKIIVIKNSVVAVAAVVTCSLVCADVAVVVAIVVVAMVACTRLC